MHRHNHDCMCSHCRAQNLVHTRETPTEGLTRKGRQDTWHVTSCCKASASERQSDIYRSVGQIVFAALKNTAQAAAQRPRSRWFSRITVKTVFLNSVSCVTGLPELLSHWSPASHATRNSPCAPTPAPRVAGHSSRTRGIRACATFCSAACCVLPPLGVLARSTTPAARSPSTRLGRTRSHGHLVRE